MPAPEKIDEQRYRDGRAAWERGVSLRAVFESIAKATADGTQTHEQEMSFMLGFADGALGALRQTTTQTIEQTVTGAVADTLGLPVARIGHADPLSDLGADQRDMTDILDAIERRAGIALPSDLEDANTVGDLIAALRSAGKRARLSGDAAQ